MYDLGKCTTFARAVKWARMRPVALAGATGGLASWLLAFLREASTEVPLTVPGIASGICECFQPPGGIEVWGYSFDLVSVAVGLILGLILGPVLDCLYLLRQLWVLHLRNQFSGLRPNRGGYRIVG